VIGVGVSTPLGFGRPTVLTQKVKFVGLGESRKTAGQKGLKIWSKYKGADPNIFRHAHVSKKIYKHHQKSPTAGEHPTHYFQNFRKVFGSRTERR
jgi:hypothetical protein